jgi:uncharacterized protein (DUF433 family)
MAVTRQSVPACQDNLPGKECRCNWAVGEYVEERNGEYYLAGTRISLDSIVQCFNEGLSPATILAEFETPTLTQVFAGYASLPLAKIFRLKFASARKRTFTIALETRAL